MKPFPTPSIPNNMRSLGNGRSETEPTFDHLYEQVLALHDEVLNFETSMQSELDHLHAAHHASARNLLHYVALRQHDVRDLQHELSALGFSSLGRSEACVLTTLRLILRILGRLREDQPSQFDTQSVTTPGDGKSVLVRNTEALFGPSPASRPVRLMVTMSNLAVHSYDHVRDLLANGMDCVRINCAHDDATAWRQMIEHLRRAQKELQKPCSVLMDLGGPKLRTGPIAPGPPHHKWKPTRDALGRVIRPVRVLLTASSGSPTLPESEHFDFHLMIQQEMLERVRVEDQLIFKDARDKWRKLRVVEFGNDRLIAECRQTAYLVPGLKLRLRRRHKSGKKWRLLEMARIADLPPTEQTIMVKPGERLRVTGASELGQPAIRDEVGQVLESAHIGCTLPEVFADLQADQQIWFDDGKIGGRIVRVTPESLEVEITQARPDGSKLGADKGINLPDSQLRLSSLTAKDIEDLRSVVELADMVGYSFVRSPNDVAQLQAHLHDLGGDHLGIVLKIETRDAVEHLPHLLLAAMRSAQAGVMIARGDLAIECGFERLAELQEEILWFCEAAHLPVIWATQVLEQLTKDGIPSRAEISDAAMGQRAECVMLNKGPHVVEAVQTLDDILTRMADHQVKKRSMLRPLKLAGRFDQ